MKTLVITNQKGGVGKTTLTVHLAHFAAERGARVLVIDLDAQAHTSFSLGEFDSGVKASSLFSPLSSSTTLPRLSVPGISLISSEGDSELADIPRAATSVSQVYSKNIEVLGSGFDVCFIDTNPAADLVQISSLIGADYVISPVDMEQYSIQGLQKLLETIFGVRAKYNPRLTFIGMIPSKLNTHSPAQKAALLQVIKAFPQFMLQGGRISLRSSIGEASAEKKPVWQLQKTAAREAGKEFKAVLAVIEDKMGGFNGT